MTLPNQTMWQGMAQGWPDPKAEYAVQHTHTALTVDAPCYGPPWLLLTILRLSQHFTVYRVVPKLSSPAITVAKPHLMSKEQEAKTWQLRSQRG